MEHDVAQTAGSGVSADFSSETAERETRLGRDSENMSPVRSSAAQTATPVLLTPEAASPTEGEGEGGRRELEQQTIPGRSWKHLSRLGRMQDLVMTI